jgi:hypothetical protein
MLTPSEIDAIMLDRRTSFTADYWTARIGDERHFNLVLDAKQPPDYRLLYDSWLWRHVINQIRPLSNGSEVLELLPGTSLTIPVALESAGFKGKLVRFNDEMPVPLPTCVEFSHRWHAGQITDLLTAPLSYDLVLGNHVIDDLLFSFYWASPEKRRGIYSDPDLCKEAWNLMSKSDSISQLQKQVINTFLELVRRMPPPSFLVLRQYPSTFALKSHDTTRINIEMDTYFSLAEAALHSGIAAAYFSDLSETDLPPGSKYPNSVLIMRKKLPVDGLNAQGTFLCSGLPAGSIK